MKTLREKLRTLPAARRKKIVVRTDQFVREEMSMRELQKAGAYRKPRSVEATGGNKRRVPHIS